jgi:hypothetical protein
VQFEREDTPVIKARNLTLALNTAQTGRTFQDRSYTFSIRSRPSNIGPMDKIFNLNVRYAPRVALIRVVRARCVCAIARGELTERGDTHTHTHTQGQAR